MRLPIPPPRQGRRDFRCSTSRVSKKKAKRTALRRRNRASERDRLPDQARILARAERARARRSPPTSSPRACASRRHARRALRARARRARARGRHRAQPRRRAARRQAHRAGRRARPGPSRRLRLPRARRRRRRSSSCRRARCTRCCTATAPRCASTGLDRRGRPEGEIVEVLERAQPRASSAACTPSTACCSSCPRTSASARTSSCRRPTRARRSPARWSIVELIAQPSKHAQPIGRVVEVLGHYADPAWRSRSRCASTTCRTSSPKAAEAQAQRLPDDGATRRTSKGRKDLRDLPLVTIDGETAKDFDDAVLRASAKARASGCGSRSPTSATTCATATRSTATRASAAPRCTSRAA